VRGRSPAPGLDILLSDDSHVVLVRKQGSSVRTIDLANTSESDLTALALSAGPSGALAVFQQGHDRYGTTQKITAVDVDPLIAAAGSSPANISIAQQVSALAPASRSFPAPVGAAAVATATAVWLTTERLDATADCRDTGQTATCSGGSPAVPWLDCGWHVDAFALKKSADLSAAAVATADGRVFVHAACDGSSPVSPGSITMNWPPGSGFGPHHASAVDPATSRLALALAYQTAPTAVGLQFALLASPAAPLVAGVNVTVSLGDPTSNAWIAARGDRVFYCGDIAPESCWAVSSNGATSLSLNDMQPITCAVSLPSGIGVVQQVSGTDGSASLHPLGSTP